MVWTVACVSLAALMAASWEGKRAGERLLVGMGFGGLFWALGVALTAILGGVL